MLMDIHTAETLAKAIARRRFELTNAGDLDALDKLLSARLVDGMAEPAPASTFKRSREFISGFLAAFPDWHATIEIMIADESIVAYRWSGQGTHRGTFMGIPPTGKRVSLTGVNIDRIQGGRIVEEWGEADLLGLLRQLDAPVVPVATDN